ncbi:hypothetical protein HDA40_005542 [Hamadaea flava]|uniref:Uncharacterized protein n=1 Tax=Hamadaea flava TaxID=1742688 RepID=A0ABV8LQY8_9ACTN|nr:hypothetical protein [Hamadaea flava]MCP2327035.1 hypothetical protein [Hamadaea flava]
MQDDALSRAVIVFVWGNPRRGWPGSHPDAVRDLFGDQAGALLSRIDALISEAGRVSPDNDLAVYGRRVAEALQSSHPELSDEARKAVAEKSTYSWR